MKSGRRSNHHAGRYSCRSYLHAEDMMRAGRDVEKNVLSRALTKYWRSASLFTVIGRLFFNLSQNNWLALIRYG